MNNEPVAWVDEIWITRPDLVRTQNLDIGRLFMRSAEGVKNYIPLYTHPAKTLTEILATIKCIADDVSPHKEYENTYSDGWIDACNTVYDEVFAILRKAQEK